jgi:hypothetical protein
LKKTTSHIVIGVVSLLLILNNTVVGQELSNVRFKKFYPESKSIKIDSFSLVPGSVSILDSGTDSILAVDRYTIDEFSATLTWKEYNRSR